MTETITIKIAKYLNDFLYFNSFKKAESTIEIMGIKNQKITKTISADSRGIKSI